MFDWKVIDCRRKTISRNKKNDRRLNIELLEGRQLLAGDVLASVVGGTLVVTGDAAANLISITSGNAPGDFVVKGKATQVNGNNQAQTFLGITSLKVELGDGDDSIQVRLANIDEELYIDGGLGDDEIGVQDSTVGRTVYIFGDRNINYTGVTGDDNIQVKNLNIAAVESAFATAEMYIYGDFNQNSNVTGGNDSITVRDSHVLAEASLSNIYVEIAGDFNRSSSMVGGNDSIEVKNTTFESDNMYIDIYGGAHRAENSGPHAIVGDNDEIRVQSTTIITSDTDSFYDYREVRVGIYGDINLTSSSGFFGDGELSAQGGNDVIEVKDTTVTILGAPTDQGDAYLRIYGDITKAVASFGGDASVSFEGGYDEIDVTGTSVTTSGSAAYGRALLEVYGDEVEAVAFPGSVAATASLDGGHDNIRLKDSNVIGSTDAVIGIYTDWVSTAFSGTVAFGGGNDVVQLRNVIVSGSNNSSVDVETGDGDDQLTVLSSAFDEFFAQLGAGDDVVVLKGNLIGILAELDGGDDDDSLSAKDNTGTLLTSGFEDEDVK